LKFAYRKRSFAYDAATGGTLDYRHSFMVHRQRRRLGLEAAAFAVSFL
jgi:hypothetical protein